MHGRWRGKSQRAGSVADRPFWKPKAADLVDCGMDGDCGRGHHEDREKTGHSQEGDKERTQHCKSSTPPSYDGRLHLSGQKPFLQEDQPALLEQRYSRSLNARGCDGRPAYRFQSLKA
jgi:hypothetical protein